MTKTFFLKLLTPDRSVLEEQVESVILPGSEGEFEVQAGHTRFVSLLQPGHLRYTLNAHTSHFAIRGGFAEVHSQGLTVLAEGLERADQIDVERAEQAKKLALEKLAPLRDATTAEYRRWHFHLERAENRLRIAKNFGKTGKL